MPATSGPVEPGPASAMLALGRTLLGMLRTRTSLLGIELVEQQHRLLRLALYAGVGLICVGLALQLLAFTVVAWFWDTAYRLPVAGGLALFCVAGTAACLVAARRLLAGPRPFEATLLALAADIEGLA